MNQHRRVTKRSSNACSRCRRQKIKCSGQQPCRNCDKRSLACIFDDRDNKVLVTQGYLSDLQAKVARLERRPDSGIPEVHPTVRHASEVVEGIDSSYGGNAEYNSHRYSPGRTAESSPRSRVADPDGANLMNPLIEAPSKFMSSSTGRTFYLGTSSNWSFHGQVLNLVHEHTHKSPLPGADLLFDGSAYDLPWDGSRSVPDSSAPTIPSKDYAIFLINAFKFHCGQLVHLFDEDEFHANMDAFYSRSDNRAWKESLWYIHFLLIIAFGKTFVQPKQHDSRPSGAHFFVHALRLLPDTTYLCQEPVVAAEVLCCKAVYLQALDSRNAAYVTIGQAMRIALAQGMHTDMPVENLGEPLVQRCRKIWWTIYILDRQMTSLMGLPQSIQDDDISCRLPTYSNSDQRAPALSMLIKFARIFAEISQTVYGLNGQLRKKFVVSIKTVLDSLASVADELRKSFPLQADERFVGISRKPAHLHLLYYQTIIVVTRPLLFCCLKKIFESPRQVSTPISSKKIRQLLSMSVEASQKTLNIAESLQDQGLLETFLPWDLDALFVSTTVFLLTQFVDFTLLDNQPSWLDKAYNLLEAIASSGNRIAAFRIIELRKLDEMLKECNINQNQSSTASPSAVGRNSSTRQASSFPEGYHSMSDLMDTEVGMGPSYTGFSDEGSVFGDDLTAEQILAVAESMDLEGMDWLSFPTLDNFPIIDPQL